MLVRFAHVEVGVAGLAAFRRPDDQRLAVADGVAMQVRVEGVPFEPVPQLQPQFVVAQELCIQNGTVHPLLPTNLKIPDDSTSAGKATSTRLSERLSEGPSKQR